MIILKLKSFNILKIIITWMMFVTFSLFSNFRRRINNRYIQKKNEDLFIYIHLRMNGCILFLIPSKCFECQVLSLSFFPKTLGFSNSLLKSNTRIRISQTITHREGYQHQKDSYLSKNLEGIWLFIFNLGRCS